MELGALIANEKLDYLIFFWDPLQSLPHDVDVKALLRIAVLYNVPTACARHQGFKRKLCSLAPGVGFEPTRPIRVTG